MDRAARFQELFALPTDPRERETDDERALETKVEETPLDDRARLHQLFGVNVDDAAPDNPTASTKSPVLGPSAHPRAPPAQDAHLDDNGWPRHNYNAAYQAIRRHRPTRRPHRTASETELWEIHNLLENPPESAPDTTEPATPGPPAWPDHRPIFEPSPADAPLATDASGGDSWNHEGWLERIADERAGPVTTEARLVRTLWGDPARVTAPLFETQQTLYARDPAQKETVHGPSESAPAAMRRKAHRFLPARLRTLILRTAVLALGLKIGVTVGYAASFLL